MSFDESTTEPKEDKSHLKWWDLRSALPTALGEALLTWSKEGVGYFSEWGTREENIAILTKHGQALLTFAEADSAGPIHISRKITEDAQEAIRWCADNLEYLWD